ncbi:MAG: dTDP-4-dehydrorhamnose reductase, partial [Propionivibrio sp.]
MKILLFGKNGQVGWELQRSLAPLGEVIAVDFDSGNDAETKGLCGDFTDRAGLAGTVRKVRPDIIVNAAAYTAVDQAETEAELAHRINALSPGVLADEARDLGAWLVHYSTDYVFDGSGDTPWQETDAPGPLNVYGNTKLAGEKAVTRCNQHLIFRTSWVYAARGANFAKTMLRLAQERDQLKVIADQIGAPTGAELLADVTAHALRAALSKPNLAGLQVTVGIDQNGLAGIQ